MRPDLRLRLAGLLAVPLVAALLASVAPSSAPPAHAGESSGLPGNYVALDKPARVLSKSFVATTASFNSINFTAVGVQGIPLNTTRALVIVATLKTNDAKGFIALCSNFSDGTCVQEHYLASTYGVTTAVSAQDTLRVDAGKTTNQLHLYTTKQAATVTVDVLGYYTSNAAGGGLVPTRQTTLLDTRSAPEVIVPAGGVLTRKLTGGIIPEGATAAHLNISAGSITAAGSVIAVPAPVDPAGAYPVMTFWNGASTRNDLAVVKLPADGRVTFKNTSTKPVHLMVRAQAYVTDSPATGADYQPYPYADGRLAKTVLVEPGATREIPVAGYGVSGIPSTAAALPVGVSVSHDTGEAMVSGYVRVYPKGQAASSSSALTFNASMGGDREGSAVVVPGHLGTSGLGTQVTRWVVVDNVSDAAVWVRLDFHAYFTGPQNAVTAGGDPLIGVARTSAGPCYGYSEPGNQAVTAACADDYDQASVGAVWTPVGGNEKFRGPVAVASRPGGRFVVAAVHAPDGELWTWEYAHTSGALPATPPIRTFRSVRGAVVAANLPDGKPVGFVKDVQGRWWALDLDVASPEQPHWKRLDIPAAAVAPVGDLTVVGTPTGIQLAARTASGDVVTGSYTAGATSLGWRSLGATDTASKVGLGVAQSGDLRLAVRRTDDTVWSARLDPATGLTVDGWHPVGVPDPAVAPLGTPSVIYDPYTGRNGVLVRSGATSSGALYRVWESAPGSGDFSGAFTGISLESSGIATDLTTWDHRTEEPLYRRWMFVYVDGSGGKRIGGSFVS